MPNILTSNPRLAEFILSEASGQRSRENIVVVQTGAEVKSGTLLTKIDTGAATATATVGNVGNPVIGTITPGAAAIPGNYKLTFTAATKFAVEDPNGVTVGSGTTGVAFNKSGMAFTVTAGGTAAVAGDEFTIAVATGSGKYTPYVAGGASGSADGILYNWLPAATGDTKAVGFVRDMEANKFALTGLDAGAQAQLAAKGILVRGV